MKDNYHRLVEVVTAVCTRVLLATMTWLVMQDKNAATTSVAKYVSMRSATVLSLYKRKKLTNIQIKLVRNSIPDEYWDVSIWCTLILGLFSKLPNDVRISIETIRTERNKLSHKGYTGLIDKDEFTDSWNNIERSLIRLTKASSNNHLEAEARVRQELKSIMESTVSRSQKQLRIWYSSCIDTITERTNKRIKSSDALDRLRGKQNCLVFSFSKASYPSLHQ